MRFTVAILARNKNGVKSALRSASLSSLHGRDERLPALVGAEDVENGGLLRD